MQPSFNTWRGLLYLLILLAGIYLILWAVLTLLENFGRRDLGKKKVIDHLRRAMIFYRFTAISILILGFISINYITHGLLLLFIGVFGYHHLKNYVTGVFLKMSTSLKKGSSIAVGSLEGVVERLLNFGVSISTKTGEHYLTYQQLEQAGFTVKSDRDSALRKTIFLNTHLSSEQLLDILFDNPILDLKEKPTVGTGEQPDQLKLQYTLEKGSSNDDFLAFLSKNKIEINSTSSSI